ncbi:hypothetical protein TWF173_007330 [Orbilia oligospora]|nr:hypothetical protein TWF173_007330 [Orbilia oligospora]
MQILNSAVALAVLSFVSPISGQIAIIGAKGDQKFAVNGQAFDATVFASPAVEWEDPPCWMEKGKQKCHLAKYRVPVKQKNFHTGCGVTLHTIGQYAKYRDELWNVTAAAHRRAKFFQQPVKPGAMVNITLEIEHSIKRDKLTAASAGGFIQMTMHVIVPPKKGEAKITCRIDPTGTGTTWLPVPGVTRIKSHKVGGIRRWEMLVDLPKDLNCKGTHRYRKTTNLCILRCENQAKSGNVGGCVPFRQVWDNDREYSTTNRPGGPKPSKGPDPVEEEKSNESEETEETEETVDYDAGSDYSDDPAPYDSY